MTELTIDGDPFHVVIEGDGAKPVVVLSNSLGTSLAMWDAQMPALLQHFRVVRYDSRGHGASAVGDRPYSLDRLGRDVVAILDALDIDRAHFIGLSMGGAVGQWLLVNAPERIDRAILANTAARLGSADGWNARIGRVLAGGADDNAKATIERWFSPAFVEAQPEIVSAFEDGLRRISPEGYAFSCAALRDMDLRQAVREVQHPVLVISGADDPVTSADDIAHLAALPNARHVTLPARHISNVEAAHEFDRVVLDFLTRSDVVSDARRSRPAPRLLRKPRRAGRRDVGGRSVAARKPIATPRRGAPAKATVASKVAPRPKTSPAKTPPTKTSRAKASPARASPARAKTSPAKASPAKRSAAKPKATQTTARTALSGPTRQKRPAHKAAAATSKHAVSPAKTTRTPRAAAAAKAGAHRRKAAATDRRAKPGAPMRRPTSAGTSRVGKATAPRTATAKGAPSKGALSKAVAASKARTTPRGKATVPSPRTKVPTRRAMTPAPAARGGKGPTTKASNLRKPVTKRVSPKQAMPKKPSAARRKPPTKPPHGRGKSGRGKSGRGKSGRGKT